MYVFSFIFSRSHISLMLSSCTDMQLKKKKGGGGPWYIKHKEMLGFFMRRGTSFDNIESELPKPQLAAIVLFHSIWLYQEEFGSSKLQSLKLVISHYWAPLDLFTKAHKPNSPQRLVP